MARFHVSETEDLPEQPLHEGDCGCGRGRGACGEVLEQSRTDSEVSGDLVAEGESFGDAIVGVSLGGRFARGDAGEHDR